MSKPKCTPLKITAHLVDARINSADGVIMFDSILYHAWFAKNAPDVLCDGGIARWNGYIGLPLRQLPDNRWAASRGIYQCIDKRVECYNKRPDFFAADKIDYLDKDKGVVSSSVGIYRAYRVPCVIRTVQNGDVTFYAIGHKAEVAELLSYIPAFGKKNSMGFGFVDKWTVEDIENDYTLFHPQNGLMRPLPIEEAETALSYPVMEYAVKPPYWKAQNKRLCYVPIEV